MQIARRAFIVLSSVVLLGGATAVLADQAQPSQPAPKAMTAEGELLKVDTEAKTIAVKTAAGDQQFVYTDQTQVEGAQKTIAGLAAAKGTRVRVHFTEEGGAKRASRIEVQAAK
jgi:hypothetical protein